MHAWNPQKLLPRATHTSLGSLLWFDSKARRDFILNPDIGFFFQAYVKIEMKVRDDIIIVQRVVLLALRTLVDVLGSEVATP